MITQKREELLRFLLWVLIAVLAAALEFAAY